MESFEIPGTAQDTALRFEPADDGRLIMTVMHRHTSGHSSVILRPEWLRPLAAWFAGEAEPGITGHDEYGRPYGRWLAVAGDDAAIVQSTHSRAELECNRPFGTARVTVGPHSLCHSLTVMITPGARTDVAAYLRQTDAEHWTKSAA